MYKKDHPQLATSVSPGTIRATYAANEWQGFGRKLPPQKHRCQQTDSMRIRYNKTFFKSSLSSDLTMGTFAGRQREQVQGAQGAQHRKKIRKQPVENIQNRPPAMLHARQTPGMLGYHQMHTCRRAACGTPSALTILHCSDIYGHVAALCALSAPMVPKALTAPWFQSSRKSLHPQTASSMFKPMTVSCIVHPNTLHICKYTSSPCALVVLVTEQRRKAPYHCTPHLPRGACGTTR